MTSDRDEQVAGFVRANRGSLLRAAVALTAGDRFLAEDLVQSTLVRLYVAWPRASSGNTRAYAHRSLVNAYIDHGRRPFRRRERLWAQPPDVLAGETAEPRSANEPLLAALAALGPGMRAAVVLRHVEGLTVEETARALGCSAGTVKSQTARGLERLRALLAETQTSDSTEGVRPCAT